MREYWALCLQGDVVAASFPRLADWQGRQTCRNPVMGARMPWEPNSLCQVAVGVET